MAQTPSTEARAGLKLISPPALYAILMLAALSFLGLGPRPPVAEWGAMIALGSQNLGNWWVSLFPGLAIFTIVLAFNMLGDSIQDVLDPRSRNGRRK